MKNREEINQENQAIKSYLETQSLLIVDPGASSRLGIIKILCDLGAQPTRITQAASFEEATECLAAQSAQVVVAEYNLKQACGLELLQRQRERLAQEPDEDGEGSESPSSTSAAQASLFMIITGNTSQSAVARSAEEDIDAYILKPFSANALRNVLLAAILAKIRPSEYARLMEQGKGFLQNKNLGEAEKIFKKTLAMAAQPTLACYYMGQISALQNQPAEAQAFYERGLGYNRIHFKCLSGLFELLNQAHRRTEAYEIAKRIIQYFPANPKRLSEVLKLAIETTQYDDIEKYFTLYKLQDNKTEDLVRHMSAALVICGRQYLNQTMAHRRAFDLLNAAASVSGNRPAILKEIILGLAEHHMSREAAGFLPFFPRGSEGTVESRLCKLYVADLQGSDNRGLLEKGKVLLAEGIFDAHLLLVLHQHACRRQLLADAEAIIQAATQHCPALLPPMQELSKKTNFKKVVPASTPSTPPQSAS